MLLFRPAGAALILFAGCHLALGLEEAAELDESTTSMPDPPECNDATDCEDDNPCTTDRCIEGQCDNEQLSGPVNAALQVDADCKQASCDSGVLVQMDDDADTAVDNNDCTDDVCMQGVPLHPNTAGGTMCATGVCNGLGECTECFTNQHCQSPESCGGGGTEFTCGCTPDTCQDLALTCGKPPNGCFGALNCDDASMNGDETDVDCGGPTTTCPNRCTDGQNCDFPSDCNSNTCTMGACVGN